MGVEKYSWWDEKTQSGKVQTLLGSKADIVDWHSPW